MILEPLAAAASTLSDEDREYGCALVNIGAEITSLMIFGRGAVQHTAVFPFGGFIGFDVFFILFPDVKRYYCYSQTFIYTMNFYICGDVCHKKPGVLNDKNNSYLEMAVYDIVSRRAKP